MFGRAELVGRAAPVKVKGTSRVGLAGPVSGRTRGCLRGSWEVRTAESGVKKLKDGFEKIENTARVETGERVSPLGEGNNVDGRRSWYAGWCKI